MQSHNAWREEIPEGILSRHLSKYTRCKKRGGVKCSMLMTSSGQTERIDNTWSLLQLWMEERKAFPSSFLKFPAFNFVRRLSNPMSRSIPLSQSASMLHSFCSETGPLIPALDLKPCLRLYKSSPHSHW